MEKHLPRVSIIVTSLNSENTISECLNSLTHQQYDDFEVIIVDGGSTDGTVEIARRIVGGRRNFHLIVDESANTPGKGRNRGVNVATGEFLAFTDSDCTPEPDWISRLVSAENWCEDTGGVGGRTLFTAVPSERRMLRALHDAIMTWLGNGGSPQFFDYENGTVVRSLPSCNVMYRANVFVSHGGFDERLRYCEDSCLNARIRRSGHRLSYVSEAIVRHKHRDSIKRFVRWIYNYGRGRASAMERDWNAISSTVVILGTAAVLFSLLAAFHVLPLGVLTYTSLGIYCGLALAFASKNADRRSKSVLLYIAAYPLIHISYVSGLLVGLLSPLTTIPLLSRPHSLR